MIGCTFLAIASWGAANEDWNCYVAGKSGYSVNLKMSMIVECGSSDSRHAPRSITRP